MKKILSLFLIIFIITIVSGCDLLKSKEERMLNELNESESYTLTLSVEDNDDERIILKVEDEKIYVKSKYTSGESVEIYYSIEDDKNYEYNNLLGYWTKEEVEAIDESLSVFLAFKELEFSWFDKIKDDYILNRDYYDQLFENYNDIEEITLEVDGDSIIIYIYPIDEDDEYIKLVINAIDETEVELPEVGGVD